jgi:hypothetical protein
VLDARRLDGMQLQVSAHERARGVEGRRVVGEADAHGCVDVDEHE